MPNIEGIAKRYDGSPVDYVSIFNWENGKCIAQVVPDVLGNWTYNPLVSLNCGITYVSDGCQPITHGPYNFAAAELIITSGFILISRSTTGTYYGNIDVTNTTAPTWEESFLQTKDIGLLDYKYSNSGNVVITSTDWQVKTINSFNIDWVISVLGINAVSSNDDHKMTFEILDADNEVLFALKSQKQSGTASDLQYGNNLSSLVATGVEGSWYYTSGALSFTETKVIYVNSLSSNYNKSFTFDVNLATARKVRVGGSSRSSYLAGGQAGCELYIRPMT